MDLPHIWSAWMRQTLLGADDVVIVATPDWPRSATPRT
jgi:pilus assembly protein CpaE